MATTSSTSAGAGKSSRSGKPSDIKTTRGVIPGLSGNRTSVIVGTDHGVSHSADNSDHRSLWSYQKRYDFAISQGASPAQAKEYASRQYDVLSDSGWDKFAHRFGAKLSSTSSIEANDARDADFLADILDRKYQEDYQDPSAEIERRENAGLNDALTGGSEIGTGDTTDINDEANNQGGSIVNAINQRSAQMPFDVASSLMSALGGVVNLVNSGVGVASSVLDMDVTEASTVFDILNKVSDIGDFFPMLNFQYDVKDKSFYEGGETIEGVRDTIDASRISSMSYQEFARRMRKSTGIKSSRIMHSLYSSYKGMASPKAVNSYVEQFNKNQDLSNKVVDSAVAGFGRYGSMTPTSAGLTAPISLFADPAFNKPIDQTVLGYYRDTSVDIFQTGLELNLAQNISGKSVAENEKVFADTQMKITDEVLKLVTNLQADAAKGSMLATYLLVNMMSSSFTDVGQAAYTNTMNIKPQSFGEGIDLMKDWSMMNFLQMPKLMGNIMKRDLPSKLKIKGGSN